mmetsp:Transcript_8678/g.19343  ORF Transcript_8678/g.19343 Transcript_8678/m.19343 type:complete len:774 (+) Transcript_8678:106-2427(+)
MLWFLTCSLVGLGHFSAVNGVAVAAEATASSALERVWAGAQDGDKPVSPVQRVVKLLKTMQEQLAKEAAKEEEMYDEMVCWCETTVKEKTKAIEEATVKEGSLEAEIQERAARGGELSANIAAMKKKLGNDADTMSEARAIREKEKKAFEDAQTEMISAIQSLESAIQVLSKHHDTSFLQGSTSQLSSMRAVLRDAAIRYEFMRAAGRESGTPERRRQRVSLLSIGSQSQEGATATDKLLLSALDPKGASLSDALPVKFAVEVLQNSAAKQPRRGASTAAGFLQAGEQSPYASYSAQSGQIFGILQQMLDEFQANLEEQRKEEKEAVAAFEQLGGAKSDEVEAGKEKLDEMEMEQSENKKALADAKEDLKMTRATRSSDTEFLRNTKLRCQNLDHEWEQRSKTRSAEATAVSEALAILLEDDNADLLRQTSTAFLQERSSSRAQALRSAKAVAVLQQGAASLDFATDDLLEAWHGRNKVSVSSPKAQLSTLALAVKLDSFTKVKEMIDKMVADLKAEQAEEAKFKAFCQKELGENAKETQAKTMEKQDAEDEIDRLSSVIEKLEKEIAAAQKQIEETNLGIKKASQTREEENAEYQSVVKDQRAMQAILKKVLDRLKKFYKDKKAGKFMQMAEPTPALEFTNYTKSQGASPVMSLIAQIIEDSAAVEAEAVTDEKSAQSAYETLVKDSNSLTKELSSTVAEKSKAVAAAKLELEEAKSDKSNAQEELELLASNEEDLHNQCDFVLKNFDVRQKARAQEMESIQTAKGILSGAK